MLKGSLLVLSGYLGKWVYEFFSGRRAKSQSLAAYLFPGFFALIWFFLAIAGLLGIFFDLGASARDSALTFGGCVAIAVILWLACLPLRNAEKKKAAKKAAEEQTEIQGQAEYKEENGVAPLLCNVEGKVETETVSQPADLVVERPVSVPTPQAMFCRKCGARLQTDSLFCNKCGTKVTILQQVSSPDEHK